MGGRVGTVHLLVKLKKRGELALNDNVKITVVLLVKHGFNC